MPRRSYQQKIINTKTVGAVAVGIDKFGMIYKAVTLELHKPYTWQNRYGRKRNA